MQETIPIHARLPESESLPQVLDRESAVEIVDWLRRRRLALPPGSAHSDARIVARIVHLQRDADVPAGQTLRVALQHDLAAELVAIRSLRQLIPYLESDDPTTRPRIEGLLEAEVQHADDLADLIAAMRP